MMFFKFRKKIWSIDVLFIGEKISSVHEEKNSFSERLLRMSRWILWHTEKSFNRFNAACHLRDDIDNVYFLDPSFRKRNTWGKWKWQWLIYSTVSWGIFWLSMRYIFLWNFCKENGACLWQVVDWQNLDGFCLLWFARAWRSVEDDCHRELHQLSLLV